MNPSGDSPRTFRNILLNRLSPASIDRLELVKVQMPLLREIEFPDNEINHLFFLEAGIASMTNTFRDGSQVEVGLCGYEAVLGSSYLLGTGRSLNRVYMQVEGWGYQSKIARAAKEFSLHGEFHQLVLRYTQAQFIQSTQTAGCNAHHPLEQRLARWLLLCHDRIGNGHIAISQEFIAQMLGARRTTISLIAGRFKKAGLINYMRGKITIEDRAALEQISCECYATVREHLLHYADSEIELGRHRITSPPLGHLRNGQI